MSTPVTSLAQYRVKPGSEEQFLEVLDRHNIVLRDLELVTDRATEVYVGAERGVEGPFVVEVFDWVDGDAAGRAHTHPRISALWESMAPLCEERGGRPMFEFVSLRRLDRE